MNRYAAFEQAVMTDPRDYYQKYMEYAPTFFRTKKKFPERLAPLRGKPEQMSYSKRGSFIAGFPVEVFKYVLLKRHYPTSVFFYSEDYDIDTAVVPINIGEFPEMIYTRSFMKRGANILLTISVEGVGDSDHATAAILKPDGTCLFINTGVTSASTLTRVKSALEYRTGMPITVIDVIAGLNINLQDVEDDLFCVTWMLLALYKNGGDPDVSVESLQSYIQDMKREKDAAGGNTFIINALNEFRSMYSLTGGKRGKKTRRHRRKHLRNRTFKRS